jgi:RNA polymerase sigma factor (sigma-70 family)
MESGTSIGFRRAAAARLGDGERAEWHRRASGLYEDLRRPATGLIRRAYGAAFSDDEIDDIYSSAWLGTLRALERRHTDLADEEIRSYLLTAVANHASKELRRRKRKPIAPIEAAGAVVDSAATPEDSATTREASQITRDLLASLPPRRRAVMLLRYGWGLDPSEVCRMVKGLSPRAYRKEITRGVNELAAKLRLVEDGRWCEEREPLLTSYAAGLADDDEVLQAEHHLAHCRSCHEFVAKLNGHLHDMGSGLLVPGALEAVDPDATLFERIGDAGERVRETVGNVVSRPDVADAVAGVSGARGAGATGAGLAAKLAGLGGAGKVALACLGGGAAATACVAAGIGPVTIGGSEGSPPATVAIEIPGEPRAIDPPRDPGVSNTRATTPGKTQPPPGVQRDAEPDGDEGAATRSQPPVAPEAPPVPQEFGVESAAAPAPSAPASASGGGGGGSTAAAVKQEFGP